MIKNQNTNLSMYSNNGMLHKLSLRLRQRRNNAFVTTSGLHGDLRDPLISFNSCVVDLHRRCDLAGLSPLSKISGRRCQLLCPNLRVRKSGEVDDL